MVDPAPRATATLAALVFLAATAAGGGAAGRVVASQEPGWPQFRGPRRNGVSAETGLLQAWPLAAAAEHQRDHQSDAHRTKHDVNLPPSSQTPAI